MVKERCPDCGADLALVGRVHNCRRVTFVSSAAGRKVALTAEERRVAGSLIKTGRPRLEDRDKTNEARKPWEALGMSKRTWYRRRAEGKGV